MNHDPKQSAGGAKGGPAAVGLGVLAVLCCAGGPMIAGALGSVALGSVLGVGAGVLAVVVVGTMIVLRSRNRRGCSAPRGQAPLGLPRRGGGS